MKLEVQRSSELVQVTIVWHASSPEEVAGGFILADRGMISLNGFETTLAAEAGKPLRQLLTALQQHELPEPQTEALSVRLLDNKCW